MSPAAALQHTTSSALRFLGAPALLAAALLLHPAPAAAQPPPAMKPSQLVQSWTHPSGAQIFLVEKHDLPYVSFNVTLRTGGAQDPPDKVGLASLTAEMLLRGAGDRDREALEALFDNLGSEVEVSTGRLSTRLEADAIKRHLDVVMAAVADVLLRPTFPADELDKLKRLQSAEITRVRDKDQELNSRFFRRYLFGAHPYGQPSEGTLLGVEAVTLNDIRAHYARHLVASNLIFGFAGDVTRAEVEALLKTHFATLPQGEAPKLALAEVPHVHGRQVLLVDKPGRTQNQILIGHTAPTLDTPDLFALHVVNTLFGGTFTARLNHEVRDQRGLSYGAYSDLDLDPVAGTFTLWTYPAADDAMKTIQLLIELYENLRATPLTADELQATQRYLVNSFAFRIDTPDRLLSEALQLALDGRPLTWLDTWTERIQAVTVDEANAAIQRHLDPANFLLVMLCTAASFEEPLQKTPGVTTVKVVPYDAGF